MKKCFFALGITMMALAPWAQVYADVVMLKDGTRIYGHLTEIPALKYSFGPMLFEPDAVAEVRMHGEGNNLKAEVITKAGLTYLAHLDEETLVVDEDKIFDLSDIKHIRLTDSSKNSCPQPLKVVEVEFKNGDILPVRIKSLAILDQGQEKRLSGEEIVSLYTHDEPTGQRIKEGKKFSLDGLVILDDRLCGEVAHNGDRYRFLLSDVARISQPTEAALLTDNEEPIYEKRYEEGEETPAEEEISPPDSGLNVEANWYPSLREKGCSECVVFNRHSNSLNYSESGLLDVDKNDNSELFLGLLDCKGEVASTASRCLSGVAGKTDSEVAYDEKNRN